MCWPRFLCQLRVSLHPRAVSSPKLKARVGFADARVATPAVSHSLPQQRQVVSPPPPTFMVMCFWAQSFLFAPDVKI